MAQSQLQLISPFLRWSLDLWDQLLGFKGSDQWKMRGGGEAGKCSKVVPDRGDRCLFIFLWSRRLFCNVFPFPACRAQLIGDWYENRRGAQNTIIFLTIRQYYWRTDAPCANRNGGPNTKKNLRNIIWILLAHSVWLHCLLAEGDIGAQISTSVNSSVRLTFFHTNRLLNELYKQETEIRWRNDDVYIKKETDIDRHSPVSPSTRSQPLNPPNFSLPTTFTGIDRSFELRGEIRLIWSVMTNWRLGNFFYFILKGHHHKISKKPQDAA